MPAEDMPIEEPETIADPEPVSEPTAPEPVAMPELPATPEPMEPEPVEEPTSPEPMEPGPFEEPASPEPMEPEPVDEPTDAPAPEPVAMPEPELPEPPGVEEPTSEEPAVDEPTEEMAEGDSEEPTNSDEERATGADPSLVGCENSSPEEFEAAMLAYTNQLRAQARQCPTGQSFAAAAPLTWNDQLAAAARDHSQDQADNDIQSHIGTDGLEVGDRATNAGYVWSGIAENISPSQGNVVEVHEGFNNPNPTGTSEPTGWINSPGHCDNIMNPDYENMGAACVEQPGNDASHRWTVKFGSPR